MKILLGVTGSVAATLTPNLAQKLLDEKCEVQVITTQRGLYFFDKTRLKVKVWEDKDEWQEGGYLRETPVPHIDLALWADAMLIAPLSANTLADLACGRCDKFLTCVVRAWPLSKPIIVAPAMNTRMWENPITKKQLDFLREVYNFNMINPIEKRLACGEVGMGAMAEISDIVKEVKKLVVLKKF